MRTRFLTVFLAVLIWPVSALAEGAKCDRFQGPDDGFVECKTHDGLAIVLRHDPVENAGKSLVVRFYGGTGPHFDQGAPGLLYEDIVGEAPGEVLRFGKRKQLLVGDLGVDGVIEVAVPALVPVNGAERKLVIYSLSSNPMEFTGRFFFRHAPGTEEKLFLSAPFSSEISIGRTLSVKDRPTGAREYKFESPNVFRLISDTRPGHAYSE